MKIKLSIFSFICMFFLIACSVQTYDKNKVIATLKGTEIKVSDILTQYPLEDEYIEVFLKEEIIIQEAKSLGIRVSEQKIEKLKQTNYPSGKDAQINDFYKKQAEVLKITPEEYYEIWTLTYLKRNEYIQEYIKYKFSEPSSPKEGEEWGKEIKEHINKLFIKYKENNDLTIKN